MLTRLQEEVQKRCSTSQNLQRGGKISKATQGGRAVQNHRQRLKKGRVLLRHEVCLSLKELLIAVENGEEKISVEHSYG